MGTSRTKALEDLRITRSIDESGAMGYLRSSEPGKVVVVVHRRFSFLLFALVPLWIAGWLTAVVKTSSGGPELSLMTIFFGLLTLPLVYAWLWNLGGKERLEFTSSAFTHTSILFGISRRRVFGMRRINRPHFENSRRRGRSRIPSGIGFSYEGRQFRFGDNLSQRDAKEIVAAVLQQLPELYPYWGNYEEGLFELDEDMSLKLN